MFGEPLYWRETHRQPRFLVFDGRVVVLILLCILHLRAWTMILLLLTLFILYFFSRKGVSADSILRYLRAKFTGKRRSARGHDAERSFVDFGFETASDVGAARALYKSEVARMKAQRAKTSNISKKKRG